MKLETQLRQSWVGHARLCFLYNALLNVSYSFGERYHLETTRCASSQSIHTFFFFFFGFASPVSCNKSLLGCGWSLCIGKMVDGVGEGTVKGVASHFKWSKQNMEPRQTHSLQLSQCNLMLLNIKSVHIFIILNKIQLKPGREKQQS